MAEQLQKIYLRSWSKKCWEGRARRDGMRRGDLLDSKALGFPFQPNQGGSAFVYLMYLDVLSKILFEGM